MDGIVGDREGQTPHAGKGARTGALVGREGELAAIELAVDHLDSGSPVSISVEGEPGIGKTRLLTELRERAEQRHHVVLDGRAAEFDRDVPFGVIVDALDAYIGSHEPAELEGWDPVALEELSVIFPSLRGLAPSAATGVGEERYRAHRAVRWLLERLALPRKLVIVLDDLHWADDASIELIGSLLRRRPDAPVLFAVAFRPGQAPSRLLSALGVPEVRRILLDPLSSSEAEELLTGLEPRLRRSAYEQAGGNPFYLEQLARVSGRSAGPAGPSGNGGRGVPPAVSAALGEELEALAPTARRLVQAAAVVGDPFEPDLATEVAEQSDDEGLTALDELLALDLVRPTDVPRRFAFRHGIVHRAVYESAPGGWRLAAHARAAGALARRGAGAAERAHHILHCATQGDEDGISLLLEAGNGAASRAPAAAVHWFEAVLRLLPAGDPRQIDVRVSLASALRALGELERSRAALIEALELLPAEAGERRVELTAACAAVENLLGHNEDAHRRLLGAWRELPDPDGAPAAALEIELVIDGLYNLDFDQVFEMGPRALATARAIEDPVLIATATAALCLGEMSDGRIKQALAHRAEAAELVDRLADAELAPRLEALYYLSWAEAFLDRPDDALRHAERGIAISRATGDGRMLVPLRLASATPFEGLGRLTEAIEACEAAVEAARLTDNRQYQFWAEWELGWRRYLAGDLDGATDACQRSAAAGRRVAGSYMRSGSGEPGWTLGLIMIQRGELEQGLEMMLSGVGGFELENVIPAERCWALEHLAVVEVARGRIDSAERIAHRAEEEAAGLGLLRMAAVAGRARATVLLAAGDAGEAVRRSEAAIAAADEGGFRLEAAFARKLLGSSLAAAGERERAIRTLREAEAELDACGSVRERDASRRELRKLGARAEPTRRAAPTGSEGIGTLTRRELEIAALVADRKTNREIATDLFVTQKTVESHLRNIFAKLGVSSRGDVARAIEAHRREADG